MEKPIQTRRGFLKHAASAGAAAALYLGIPQQADTKEGKKTNVVLVRDTDVLDGSLKPRADVIEKMLDQAVTALVGEKEPKACWKTMVSAKDIVGVKSNVWHYLPTPRALENAIEKRLIEAGVAKKNISITDRGVRGDPVFEKATALINARPLRTHHWSGVGTLLKNYIMFVDSPSSYHPDTCADLAKIWKLPAVAGKTRLNILVCLTPLFHGTGPHHFNPKYTWAYKGMLAGFDAVAVDTVGVKLLTAKRKAYFGTDRPISPPPKHVLLADTRHDVGCADESKIRLIKIGWDKDILI
jgi:hypothetical protein